MLLQHRPEPHPGRGEELDVDDGRAVTGVVGEAEVGMVAAVAPAR